jgi:hypothetical protein
MAQVSLFTLNSTRTSFRGLSESGDQALLSAIEGTEATRNLWADTAVTTANLATGTNVTAVNLGSVSSTITIPGNLTVSGTTTTISTTNLAVSDKLIIAASGAATGDESGLAFERGSTGDDALMLWNEADDRFEFGLFDTTAGTTVPTSALTTLSDMRINNLSLDGTTVTFDGAGTITATSAVLSLDGTALETSATSLTSDGAFDVIATGALGVGANSATTSINVGTDTNSKNVTVGNNTGTSTVTLNTGSGGLQVDANGDSTWTLFDVTVTQNEVQAADSGTAGNPFSWTSGAGAAGGATNAGGAGGAITLTGGDGGAASASNNDGGAGADVSIVAGDGGAGATGQTSGAGGDLLLTAGSVGAAGGGSASTDPGRVALTSGGTQYFVTAAGTGPSLTTTAQTIIEAINEIDGAAGGTTLQGAYDNDAGSPVTITTNSTLDHIDITGTAALRVTATGVDNTVNAGFGFDVDTTGGYRIFGDASSTIRVDGTSNTLSLVAGGASGGRVIVSSLGNSADAITLSAEATGGGVTIGADTGGVAINSDGVVTVDATGNLSLDTTSTAANLSLQANSAGTGLLTILATNSGAGASDIDIDADGQLRADATGGISLDSGASASNFTVTGAADLTLSSTGGSVVVTSGEAASDAVRINASDTAGGVDIDAGTGGVAIDSTGTVSIDSTGTSSNFSIAGNDAGTVTLTLSSSNAGAGTGVIDIDADEAITIDSTAAGVSIDAVTASNFTVSGASADLTLGARGATVTLNQSGDTALSGFTATSIIGALNELQAASGSANAVSETLTNANGGAITTGQVVYLTTTDDNVDLATATSDAAAARAIAFVSDASIASTASGEFVTSGTATVRLVGSLTVSAGDVIYLSTTAGSCTNVSPSTSGNVVQPVGYVKDDLTYDGTTDFLVEIIIQIGNRAII